MNQDEKKALFEGFEPLRKAWEEAWGAVEVRAKNDLLAILKEQGDIDLTETDFGMQTYIFRSCGEVLTCSRVRLDGNGYICIDAENVDDGRSCVLGWEDAVQDETTFNDVMDAVYGVEI